jgi:hypothetical protein
MAGMSDEEIERCRELPGDVQRELLRQGEEQVRAMLQTGLAADQRAATTMSIFGAVGVGLVVASASLAASGDRPGWLLVSAALVAALALFAGAALGAFAMRPIDFFAVGFDPSELIQSDAIKPDYLLPLLIVRQGERAAANRRKMERAAKAYVAGLILAAAGALGGLILLAL